MTMATKRAILTVLFFGLLFGPPMYSQFSSGGSVNDRSTPKDELIKRYGMVLTESAKEAGIDFIHHEPFVDDLVDHIRPQVAAMGASVAVVDFDRDGWHDFYVTDSAPNSVNRLYRNQQDGTFRDVAAEVGLAALNPPGRGSCMGSVWADYDNDGYEDVLVFKWGTVELFHNERGESFQRVTEQAGMPQWANAGCATWFDYDNDGWIDLFIAGYWPDHIRLENLTNTKIMPESFEYANNGGRKWLLRNTGEGRFVDVTEEVGLKSSRWTLAVVAADFNNDSYSDLFLANDYGVSEFFVNEGGKRFLTYSKESNIGHSPKSGMNAAVGDVLNRGQLAIYQTNISEEGVLIQGNNLWMPRENNPLQFDNMASAMGVELGGWSFGAQFGDLNNDGFVDLYLTNGYVSGNQGTSYWYDFSQIAGGHRRIIEDAMNWPAMNGRSLSGYQPKRVWLNNGAGSFQEVAQLVGVKDRFDGRAVALADFENRGALDVVVANQRGPVLLYRNQVDPRRHWLAVTLEGTRSNRSAIGTQVRVFWNGQQQLQELVAASGFAAQNQRRLHFGLGEHADVEKMVIRWPSGQEQIINHPAVDQVHHVQEPQ